MKTIVVKNQKSAYAIIVGLMLVFAIIGVVLLVNNQQKTKGYVTTKARVVDYNKRIDYDSDSFGDSYMYQEIVKFTVDGKTYTATNNAWTNAPKGIGGEMKIAYDPNDPSNSVFVTNSYMVVGICFGMSLLFLVTLIITIVGNAKAKTSRSISSGSIGSEEEHHLC